VKISLLSFCAKASQDTWGWREPEVDRIDRIPEFQDWGPYFALRATKDSGGAEDGGKRNEGMEPLTVVGSR